MGTLNNTNDLHSEITLSIYTLRKSLHCYTGEAQKEVVWVCELVSAGAGDDRSRLSATPCTIPWRRLTWRPPSGDFEKCCWENGWLDMVLCSRLLPSSFYLCLGLAHSLVGSCLFELIATYYSKGRCLRDPRIEYLPPCYSLSYTIFMVFATSVYYLPQRSANSDLPPLFVNKVLLELNDGHSQWDATHLCTYCLWLLSWYKCRVEWLPQRLYDPPTSLKYLLLGPLQKKGRPLTYIIM